MPQLIPIDQKISDLEAIVDDNDVSEWENTFINSIVKRVKANAGSTTGLTSKQVEKIEELHLKFFE